MRQFLKFRRPFNQGTIQLPAPGGVLAFSEYGNPSERVILHIHGGPGGRTLPHDLAFFDLKKYRVVFYDQRHCGFSQTNSNWQAGNTTELLVQDIEILRQHLNINSWSLFGGSWGSCLGLCYAIKFPERVETQIYWGILLGRQSCINFVPAESLTPMEKFYCEHNFFMEENYILKNIHKLKDKPFKIVHGSDDVVCSVQNAIELNQNLPHSELFIAQGEGHNPYLPQMFNALENFAKAI